MILKNQMEYISHQPIKALLFDLGGVVIDIDFDQIFYQWAQYSDKPINEIRSGFKFDQHYEAHERGVITAGEYFNTLRKNLDIDITDSQFEKGWNAIYKGEFPGISDLLNKIKKQLPVYAFTNSNHLHKKTWSKKFSNILSVFEKVYISSDIGKRKPDSEAFIFVAEDIGVELHEILFYDDSIENITGAEKTGLNAVQVKSIEDIKASINLFINQ